MMLANRSNVIGVVLMVVILVIVIIVMIVAIIMIMTNRFIVLGRNEINRNRTFFFNLLLHHIFF